MTRYKVTGSSEVLGHKPGESFEANLAEDQEAFLKQIGAIKAVGGQAPQDPEAEVEKTAEQLAEEQEQEKRTES
jgi:hypothetical protein